MVHFSRLEYGAGLVWAKRTLVCPAQGRTGVNGKNRSQALGLTDGVAQVFGVNEGYKFGQTSGKVYGIAPRNFYPLDLEDEIINLLLNED